MAPFITPAAAPVNPIPAPPHAWYCEDVRALRAGGSGKRQLADGSGILRDTIGKLRRLRLPLLPVALYLERTALRLPENCQLVFIDTRFVIMSP
jgi:hypothetical protein